MINRLNVLALLLPIALVAACAGNAGEQAAAGTDHDDAQVVAYLNDTPITMKEVTEEARLGLKKLEQERYDLFRSTLEQMRTARLVEAEANARGMSVDDLRKAEIFDQVPRPSDAEVEAYYTENQSRAGGRTLEQLREPIREMLAQTRQQEKETQFIKDLLNKADFRITLEPPRTKIAMTDTDLAKGPEDAPITMIEYGDFECPYCRRAHPVVHRLLSEFKDEIRYTFRDYPLPNHNRAVPASVAARCANEQGKYWDYYQHLMVMKGDLSDQNLAQRAEEVGLNVDEFKSCYDSHRYTAEVSAHVDEGHNLGVTATPTFFINGRMVVGAKGYEEFKSVIEEELEKAGKAG